MSLQRTPLFPMHQKYKGKLIDFGGWELPVEYQGIISEHKMVRSKAGMFDVSHMGEVEVTGERSLEYLNNLLTNDFTDMAIGQIRYSPMCYEHGGVVDDLMVCKFSPTHYFLVINAANTKKDLAWMQKQAFSQGVTITDSMTPILSPASNSLSSSGSSTNTISPSWCCAKSVIPI